MELTTAERRASGGPGQGSELTLRLPVMAAPPTAAASMPDERGGVTRRRVLVVDNEPGKEFKGEDQQLDRAIQELQEELKTKRYDLPPPPPWPNRAFQTGG